MISWIDVERVNMSIVYYQSKGLIEGYLDMTGLPYVERPLCRSSMIEQHRFNYYPCLKIVTGSETSYAFLISYLLACFKIYMKLMKF